MSKEVNRKITLDGNIVIVDLGFVPDKVVMFIDDTTNIDITTYFRQLEVDNSLFGYLLTGSSGITTRLTTAATGLSAYDAQNSRLLLPAPSGQGEVAAAHPDAFVAGTAQPTARTTTVLGTLTKPSIGNENGLVAECTADNGVYGTEPTWPTKPGDTVDDDNSNTWTMRETKVADVGVKGIQIGVSVANNTDSLIAQIVATKFDKDPGAVDAGNITAGTPV